MLLLLVRTSNHYYLLYVYYNIDYSYQAFCTDVVARCNLDSFGRKIKDATYVHLTISIYIIAVVKRKNCYLWLVLQAPITSSILIIT